MVDRLFFIVLVLNTTGLFSFLAPQLGVKIGDVSTGLLGVNILYLVLKRHYSVVVPQNVAMGACLIVLLFWPLVTILYSPGIEIRIVGRQFYFFTLFFCTVVYTIANGMQKMHRAMSVSLALTIFGMILSLLAPHYFEAVSDLADAKIESEGRAFGFLLQPNDLAISINLIFIAWFPLWRHRGTLKEVAALILLLLVILLTGSRIGMVTSVLIIGLIYVRTFRAKFAHINIFAKASLLVVCLAGTIVGMKIYLSSVDFGNANTDDLIGRMEMLLNLRLSSDGSVVEDTSVRQRLEAQDVYWSLVSEKPLLGHGLGSEAYYTANGPIFLSAHSDALLCMMEYGAPYVVAFGFLMFKLWKNHKRQKVEAMFRANSVGQFVILSMFLFTITGGIIDSRTFYVVCGMFFAAVFYLPLEGLMDSSGLAPCALLDRRFGKVA